MRGIRRTRVVVRDCYSFVLRTRAGTVGSFRTRAGAAGGFRARAGAVGGFRTRAVTIGGFMVGAGTIGSFRAGAQAERFDGVSRKVMALGCSRYWSKGR